MENDKLQKYDEWNEKKKSIAIGEKTSKIYFREGDIWWCSIGLNVASESYGKGEEFRRPILIIKKLSHDTCIAIPLTSKEKVGSWFAEITIGGERKWAMLYQIKMIHKKRFQRKIAELDEKDVALVKEKLKTLLELS
jgi:mRNA interferase MazF